MSVTRLLTTLALSLALTGCGGGLPMGMALQGDAAFAASKAGRDTVGAVRAANAPYLRRDPALIQEKYQLMAESAFSFFRGSAYLFYADARQEPALKTAVRIPLQGDLHLENVGTYRTASGAVAFDLNDFDEATSGPYTYELARWLTSIHLAAREVKLSDAEARTLAHNALNDYYDDLKRLRASDLDEPLTANRVDGPAKDAIADAAETSRAKFIDKLTSHGKLKLGSKLRPASAEAVRAVEAAVAAYAKGRREGASFFKIKDVAARVAGTASLGRYRFVALLEGPGGGPDDDVLLELKEEAAPVLGGAATGAAQRVAEAYRYFLPGADPLLGTAKVLGVECVVREWQPAKGGVDLEDLDSAKKLGKFLETVSLVVARAHARAGKASAIAAEAAARGPAIEAFAAREAEQARADHQVFKRAL